MCSFRFDRVVCRRPGITSPFKKKRGSLIAGAELSLGANVEGLPCEEIQGLAKWYGEKVHQADRKIQHLERD